MLDPTALGLTKKTQTNNRKKKTPEQGNELYKQKTMFLMMEALYKCCINPGRLSHNTMFRACGKAWNNETQLGK